MSNLYLSTMWGVGRFNTLAEFTTKAEALGFSGIELNYQAPREWLAEADNLPELTVSSVHIPCPSEIALDGKWAHKLSLCSTNEVEREIAMRYALATMELATRVKASILVLHMGAVAIDINLERRVRKLYEDGLAGSKEYSEAKDELIAERQAHQEVHRELAVSSLRRLADHARSRGLKLGLENRLYAFEIPNVEEMEILLGEFGQDAVGYWHDAGHAEVQARLGYIPHQEWLKRLRGRLIGMHLHDVNGIGDHRAPGTGTLDWQLIADHLPNGAARVCELANWNEEEAVLQGVDVLRRANIFTVSAPDN